MLKVGALPYALSRMACELIHGLHGVLVCCGEKYDADISYGEALIPPDFNWLTTFVSGLIHSISITLALSLAVYGLVRAIGWVIGGFAASHR